MNKKSGLKERLFGPVKWVGKLSLIKKVLLLVVILVVGFILVKSLGGSSSQVQYQTSQVSKETIISTVSESGNVASGGQTNVASTTDGVITAVYVKNGDNVTLGQKLFSVKSTATPQDQASAYASYLSAQNNLNSAKSKMDSLQAALFQANQAFVNDKGINNPSTDQQADPKYIEENANWLQAQADYTNQQGVINQAQASLNTASLAYAATQDSTVTAPIAGTVANLSAVVGSNVTASNTTTTTSANSTSSSTSTSTGTTVLVLGNFSTLIISVPVSEVDIPNIHAGQKATITLDAFSTKTFVGKVNSVDSVGSISSGVVTYNAYIAFLYPPDGVEPGMSATAVIETARKDNVLTVPTAAIQTSNSQSYVRVLNNGKITQTAVTTGISDDTNTEIDSGLSEGQTVVTGTVATSTSSSSSSSSPFSSLTGGRGGFGGGGATTRVSGGSAVGR
ncbi:MAG TPA: HlyD family efflux transporter periplasmic adaptor subunit [Patescibacteria group bacterium]|nr:HlyD family efflux transporter periplasmic adaptor subunit [Patescibacteria group bacterium]